MREHDLDRLHPIGRRCAQRFCVLAWLRDWFARAFSDSSAEETRAEMPLTEVSTRVLVSVSVALPTSLSSSIRLCSKTLVTFATAPVFLAVLGQERQHAQRFDADDYQSMNVIFEPPQEPISKLHTLLDELRQHADVAESRLPKQLVQIKQQGRSLAEGK